MRILKGRWILVAACFLVCSLAVSAETPDGEKYWTTVGSAGTLDEDSVGKVVFRRAVVQKGDILVLAPASRQPRTEGEAEETDSAVIRYNVTAVDGLFGAPDVWMRIRFRDEGKAARVVAELVEVDIETGAKVTRMTFDSDDPSVPVRSGYHVFDLFDCGRKSPFDFTRKAYYIEATLTTSSIAESAAGIEVIQLAATECLY